MLPTPSNHRGPTRAAGALVSNKHWVPDESIIQALRREIVLRSRLEGEWLPAGEFRPGAIRAAVHRARHGPFAGSGDLAEAWADGNKRTGLEVLTTCLKENHFALAAGDEERLEFMIHVADGTHDIDDIAAWIRRHTTRTKP